MKKLTYEEIEKSGLFITKSIRGSQSYGLATPESDIDYFAVHMAPQEQIYGLGLDYQEQAENDTHDYVSYELGKCLNLCCKGNPTILENLFAPERCVLYEHPIWTDVKKHRDMFLTKSCFPAFLGYAKQQLAGAKSLKRKALNPVTERKGIIDFVYTFHKQGSSLLKNWLTYRAMNQRWIGCVSVPNMPNVYGAYYDWKNFFSAENISLDMLIDAYNDPIVYDTIKIVRDMKESEDENIKTEQASLLKKAQFKNMVKFIFEQYRLKSLDELKNWFDSLVPKGYPGICREDGMSNEIRFIEGTSESVVDSEYVLTEHAQKDEYSIILSSVSKGESPILYCYFNKNSYSTHCADYKNYMDWLSHRNEKRYINNVKKGREYDRKNSMHVIRLLTICTELAKTGNFNVDRTNIDREELLKIRNGYLTYDEFIDCANRKLKEAQDAIENSKLPEKCDIDKINDFLIDIRRKYYSGYYGQYPKWYGE